MSPKGVAQSTYEGKYRMTNGHEICQYNLVKGRLISINMQGQFSNSSNICADRASVSQYRLDGNDEAVIGETSIVSYNEKSLLYKN
jgi:hypothetical protein